MPQNTYIQIRVAGLALLIPVYLLYFLEKLKLKTDQFNSKMEKEIDDLAAAIMKKSNTV